MNNKKTRIRSHIIFLFLLIFSILMTLIFSFFGLIIFAIPFGISAFVLGSLYSKSKKKYKLEKAQEQTEEEVETKKNEDNLQNNANLSLYSSLFLNTNSLLQDALSDVKEKNNEFVSPYSTFVLTKPKTKETKKVTKRKNIKAQQKKLNKDIAYS